MPEAAPWLDAVPLLNGGRVVQRLDGGDSTDSWLVETPSMRCVVRLDRPLAARLGLDRAVEWEILQAAHAAELAPRPLARDAALGMLVTEWLEAEPWSPEALTKPSGLKRLGGLLKRVHGQAGVGPRFDPHAVAERYARAARSPALGQAVDEVARLAEQLYTDNGWALCHHDPHAGNLLGFDAPVLIDWEYAANGQPLFDLAVVIRYHRLDAAAAEILLSAWAGDGGEAHRERLAGFCQLYDLLSVLWEQAIAAG